MIKKAGVNRRQFLALTFCLGGPALIGPYRMWSALAERMGRTLSQHLIAVLNDRESARVIGLAYLRSVPQEADVQVLVELIALGFVGGSELLRNATGEKLRQLLDLRIRQDFAEERMVTLHGWLLSLTEARLCALATLV